MKEKIIEAVSNILSISAADLQADPGAYRLSNPVSWDSLAHLSIMGELEELLGKELSIAEMEELDTLEKILNEISDD